MRKMVILLLAATSVASPQETLFFNARIFTADALSPAASYMVVREGVIVRSGTSLPPEETARHPDGIDLHGKRIVPGFVDSRIHVVEGGLRLLGEEVAETGNGAPPSDSLTVQAILAAQARALACGITTIGDYTDHPALLKTYQEMQKEGSLKLRVRARSRAEMPETRRLMMGMGEAKLWLFGGGVDFRRVRYYAAEHVVDRSTPFDSIEQSLQFSSPLSFNARDTGSVQRILMAGESTVSKRNVIELAGPVSEQQLRDVRRLGWGVSVIAPAAVHDGRTPTPGKDFPPDTAEVTNYGAICRIAKGAMASDWPKSATSFTHGARDGLNPLTTIALLSRPSAPETTGARDSDRLSVEEALRSYTSAGAFVLGDEELLGRLSPGMRADFVVLTDDVLAPECSGRDDIEVEETYIDGEKVFALTPDAPPRVSSITSVRDWDYSLFPFIVYDPELGVLAGAAFVTVPYALPGSFVTTSVQVAGVGLIETDFSYARRTPLPGIHLFLDANVSTFFQNYFGEGDQTRLEDRRRLYATTFRVKPEARWCLSRQFSLSGFLDLRGRNEEKAVDDNDLPVASPVIPDESRLAGGLTVRHDSRDNIFSTRNGTYEQVSVSFQPRALSTLPEAESGVQLEADARWFRYMGSTGAVLAAHAVAGFSLGEPGYMYRYNLGGSYRLRGFNDNRFRGKQYLYGQTEARFPLWRTLAGVIFVDGGDVGDEPLRRLLIAYGAGLRIGLPPDDIFKLRLDIGFSKDTVMLVFTIGEAF